MNLLAEIKKPFAVALQAIGIAEEQLPALLAMLKSTNDSKNGDFQANMAMPLGKQLGQKPQEIAQRIIAALPKTEWIDSATVAGPGFINIVLSSAWLAEQVTAIAQDERLGVKPVSPAKTVVIDYSGPNVAKPLHVGHLRSTIIGDALVRILRFLGHKVIGDNHLGDWGTQFGILIYGYKNHLDNTAYERDPVRELARIYVHVRTLAKANEDDEGDSEIMQACRNETAKLHAGDTENTKLWQQFMPACLEMLQPIYDRLDVKIDHALGESFYHPMLADVVSNLKEKGVAVESHGAVVVPNAKGMVPTTPEEQAKEEPPALIQKRDGAFTYTTTDLATIKYRLDTWKPDAMLYVVDARQALHFKTLFANARRWGYDHVEFQHIAFGSILGLDGKPLRTRDGGVVELSSLLDDAKKLGLEKYEESIAERKASGREVPELNDEQKNAIAEAVGYGAVKYTDLSGNRTSDYKYDPKKMLATDGNTATYMQYAYARCQAIIRKSDVAVGESIQIEKNEERQLCLQLLKFEQALLLASEDYTPHVVTQYLWDLAKCYSAFYENCPVNTAETLSIKQSRLLLVQTTATTIQQALNLLGIRTVEQL